MTDDQRKMMATVPFEQKAQFFFRMVASLASDLHLEGMVVYMNNDGMHAAARWPGCNDSCPTPEECSAHIFRLVAQDLIEQARRIDDGTAETHNISGEHDA